MHSNPFYQLSLDNFELLALFLDLQDLFHLWATGDVAVRALLSKLTNLDWTMPLSHPYKWTRFLSNLQHIQHLRVATKQRESFDVDDVQLKEFSPNLKSLELDFPNALSSFADSFANQRLADTYSKLESLKLFGYTPMELVKLSSALEHLPPSLTQLSLPTSAPLPYVLLKHLLPSIASLEINLDVPELRDSSPTISFPKSLRKLDVDVVYDVRTIIASVPSSLQELRVLPALSTGTLPNWNLLPLGLLSFTSSTFQINDSLASQLPRNLLLLNLSYNQPLSLEALKVLPRNLLSLSLSASWSTCPCSGSTEEILKALPTSLLELSIALKVDSNMVKLELVTIPSLGIEKLVQASSDAKSSNIECLQLLNNPSSTKAESALVIPSRMRNMALNFAVLTDWQAEHLPSNLYELRVQAFSNDFKQVPRIKELKQLRALLVENCVRSWEEPSFADWTSTLTRLSILGPASSMDVLSLPPSLVSLDISTRDVVDHRTPWIKSLPLTLKSIAIFAGGVTPLILSIFPQGIEAISIVPLSSALKDQHLQLLPNSHLMKLSLVGSQPHSVTEKGIASLSRHLKVIDFSCFASPALYDMDSATRNAFADALPLHATLVSVGKNQNDNEWFAEHLRKRNLHP